jgi:23S rRNA pseudouridine1911/1915/1917 synthase
VAVRHFAFTVTDDDAGLRLDQLLAKRVPELSRRTARKVLLIGGVFVERARVKMASKIIQTGRHVDVHLGSALEKVTAAEKSAPPEIAIVFEDEHLVVVDKPAGLATAATRETDRHNLLHYLSQRLSSGPLHLVHRLDLETSGLLLVAKHGESAHRLSELFATHALERVYRAVLLGELDDSQTVERPIGDRPARTQFSPVERRAGLSLVDAQLDTGRTHQIRIHALHLGKSVAGDRRYGRAIKTEPPRLALHARVLGLAHPITGEPMRWVRDWPLDLADWWEALCPKS